MADSSHGNHGDIEEQFREAGSSVYQPAASVAQANPQSTDENSEPTVIAKLINSLLNFIWCITKFQIACIIAFGNGLRAIYIIAVCGDTNGLIFVGSLNTSKNEGGKDRIKMKKPGVGVKIHQLTVVTLLRTGCLVSIWLVINLSVPSLRRVTLLGSLLWKWSVLVAVMLLIYPLHIIYCMMCDYVIVNGISQRFKKSNLQFFLEGSAQSTIWINYFAYILIAWLFCIDTTISGLERYVTWTLVSLLVGAVLSVVKCLVLMQWKVKLIYNKYEGKILSAGCQLYFHLLFMSEQPGVGILQLVPWMDWERYEDSQPLPNVGIPAKETQDDHDGGQSKPRKIPPIEEYMMQKNASRQHIEEVVKYLTTNFELSLTEDDDIPDIVPKLQTYRSEGSQLVDENTIVYPNSALDKSDARLFMEILKLETSNESPTYEEFEKWMVDSLNNCYTVGNRINGAMEVMLILDRVLTVFIVVLVILIWLFITGFATTSVVVGLASMFLGLSFMFGDTCKTFFQGVIFSFVMHPFDVADRCIIEDKELKVKKINILTTTFFGSQSKEIIMYPNSDLAARRIVLLHGERESEHKSKPQPQQSERKDLIEFYIPSSTNAPHIDSLRKNIERHLEEGIQSGHYKTPYRVCLNEIGENNMKMGVHFYHNLNYGDKGCPSEAVEEMLDVQRSEFLMQVRKFLDSIRTDIPQPSK